MGADRRAGAGAEGADKFWVKRAEPEPEPKNQKVESRSRKFEKLRAGAGAENLKSKEPEPKRADFFQNLGSLFDKNV